MIPGNLDETVSGVREPYRRISVGKVRSIVGHRLRLCREAADRYAAQAEGAERDFYLRMSATERCAASEVRLIYEMLTGEVAPKDTSDASLGPGRTPSQKEES